MEALKHQGQRTDLTLVQVGPKLNSAEKIAQDSGESVSQVKRLIRLTELVPEIQQKVDAKEIALNPAVELSYLKPEEQRQFLDAMEYSQNTPSLSQAQRLKKLSREGKCTQDAMYKVMSEEKKTSWSRHAEKRYAPQILPQELHAAANGTGHYQAAGSVAEKTAAPERTLKEAQKKAGHPARRREQRQCTAL